MSWAGVEIRGLSNSLLAIVAAKCRVKFGVLDISECLVKLDVFENLLYLWVLLIMCRVSKYGLKIQGLAIL